MSWVGSRIKNLRKRMGWGVGDLARRLDVSRDVLLAWERGENSPSSNHCSQLEIFEGELNKACERLGKNVRAEEVMKENGLRQIHHEDLPES